MNFFQRVRTIHLQAQAAGRPYCPLGSDTEPHLEVLRFTVQNTLAFPATAVSRIDPPEYEDGPQKMEVTFMGLTGPSGVLPNHYTELLIERLHEKDTALRDFLDFLNHRVLSLYYRAWEKYRLYLSCENPYNERLKPMLLSFIGYGTPGLQNRLAIPDQTLFYYASLFIQQPRCAINLEMMLADYLQLPVKIEQFQGRWLYLKDEDRWRLGNPNRKNPSQSRPYTPARLGYGTILGRRVYDVQTKFRVTVGPLNYEQFESLWPTTKAFESLVALARAFAGPHLDFDVKLILDAKCVPKFTLGGKKPMRLGWNTWLKSKDLTCNPSVVFSSQKKGIYALLERMAKTKQTEKV
jgi:type VI secretion system protein ImpH